MTVLLDSWAWLEYFFGSAKGEKIKQIIENGEEVIIASKINIFEIYNKVLKERGKEETEKFTSFILGKSFLDELSVDTLKLAAEEKKKYKLGMADSIILATAIKYDATLYTGDADFNAAKDIVNIAFL